MTTAETPYYGEGTTWHHTVDHCPIGRTIPPGVRREGTGGLPLCPQCATLREARRPQDRA